MMTPRPPLRLAVVLAWLAAIALLSLADVPIATWVHDRGIADAFKKHREWQFLKWPGHFAFTLVVAALAAVAFRRVPRGAVGAAVYVLLSGIFSGLLYSLVKWCVGRTRPFKGVPPFEFHPFRHGRDGFLHAENQSFPSGHACLAFATAAAMAALFPRGRWAFYAVAVGVGVERVLEGAHYPADVAGGAACGMWCAVMLWPRQQVALTTPVGGEYKSTATVKDS